MKEKKQEQKKQEQQKTHDQDALCTTRCSLMVMLMPRPSVITRELYTESQNKKKASTQRGPSWGWAGWRLAWTKVESTPAVPLARFDSPRLARHTNGVWDPVLRSFAEMFKM
jgi:hypothetical protein